MMYMFVMVCLVDSFVAEFVMGSLDLFQMRPLYSSIYIGHLLKSRVCLISVTYSVKASLRSS